MFLNDIDRNIQSSTKGLLLLQSSLYADEPDRARSRLKFSFHTKKLPKTAAPAASIKCNESECELYNPQTAAAIIPAG